MQENFKAYIRRVMRIINQCRQIDDFFIGTIDNKIDQQHSSGYNAFKMPISCPAQEKKSIKTSKKCRNLASLQKKVKVGDKKLYIEKTQLFNRLIIMAERDEGLEGIFSFELTPVPTSLKYGSHDEKI